MKLNVSRLHNVNHFVPRADSINTILPTIIKIRRSNDRLIPMVVIIIYGNTIFAMKQDPGLHYSDVIMGAMVSQIISLMTVYSTVYSGADQRKHQGSASLASVRGIHRWTVNSPHKGPVTRKMFPFDDINMRCLKTEFAWISYIPQRPFLAA